MPAGQKKANVREVARSHKQQYKECSEEDLQRYVNELEQQNDSKKHGIRVTAGSKVMEVEHAFKDIKNIVSDGVLSTETSVVDVHMQLTGINVRVGARAIVAVVRGSTEYNHTPLFWATDDAAGEFLPKVFGIDEHDMLCKFEGYYITGGSLAGKSTYAQVITNAE